MGPLRRARTSQEVGGQGCPVQRLFLVYSLGFLPACPWRKAVLPVLIEGSGDSKLYSGNYFSDLSLCIFFCKMGAS